MSSFPILLKTFPILLPLDLPYPHSFNILLTSKESFKILYFSTDQYLPGLRPTVYLNGYFTPMSPTIATKMIETTSFNGTSIADKTSNNKMTSMDTNGKGSESTKTVFMTTKTTIKYNPDGLI